MKVKGITADGQEIEVEVSGLISAEAAQAMANDRAAQARRDAANRLIGDDEFRQMALQKWGVDPTPAPAPPAAPAVDVDKLRSTWEQEHLRPLSEQAKTLQAQVEKLRTDRLTRDIVLAATKAGVKKSLLTPPVPGAEPPIVAMTKHLYGYDEQRDGFYVREGDGFALSSNPTKERLHADVDEFFDRWSRDKGNADLLEPQRQQGAGLGGGGGQGGVVTLTREQARDARQYQAAKQQAEATGGKVVITE